MGVAAARHAAGLPSQLRLFCCLFPASVKSPSLADFNLSQNKKGVTFAGV